LLIYEIKCTIVSDLIYQTTDLSPGKSKIAIKENLICLTLSDKYIILNLKGEVLYENTYLNEFKSTLTDNNYGVTMTTY